jgi:hypothetical protein
VEPDGRHRIVPRTRGTWLVALAACGAALFAAPSARSQRPDNEASLDVKAWRLIPRESGPVDYYKVIDDPALPFIRAEYHPPYKTTVLGFQLSDSDRQRARKLRWSWRAITLPRGGDECVSGKGDSAATIYVTWRRGLRYYSLKYVWSAVGTKGAICDRKRSPFVAQDTVILQSGGPLDTWQTEEIDLKGEFRSHFGGGDAQSSVPDLLGIGLMTDGDQTKSDSSADYAGFVITR